MTDPTARRLSAEELDAMSAEMMVWTSGVPSIRRVDVSLLRPVFEQAKRAALQPAQPLVDQVRAALEGGIYPPNPAIPDLWSQAHVDFAMHILTPLLQRAAGGAWQPIATAPKDGTRVLIHTDGGATHLAEWDRNAWYLGNGSWLSPGAAAILWMPLPAPTDGAQ